MAFLKVEDNKVVLKDGAMELGVVKALYNRDKTQTKKFFSDCLTYIYWVYSKESIFANKYPEDRKLFVIQNFLPDRKVDDFEEHPTVQSVINEFVDLEKSISERFYEDIKRDMQDLLIHLRAIKWTKEVKVEKKIPARDFDQFNDHYIAKATFEEDNSEEKMAAIVKADKLIDLEDKIRQKVIKENKEQKKGKQKRRLFED